MNGVDVALIEKYGLSWTETRKLLVKRGIPAKMLPKEWHLGIRLVDVDLSATHLVGAYLVAADLRNVCLRNANLRGANLSGTILSGADLGGADLGGADLGGADLFLALYDQHTTWPDGFDPVAAGVIN